MAKDPAFLFYPNDYLGGTMGMTFEEKGAYIELLMVQFNRGHMTTHMIGQTVGQLWDNIKDKFIQDDKGLWYNIRLDEEKQKRMAYTASRRNNIKGENQHTKKKKSGHMTTHMENENEDVLLNNKESVKGSIFSDQQFIEELKRMHRGKDLSSAFDQCWIYFSQKPHPPEQPWEWRQKLSSWLINFKQEQAALKLNKIQ
jgi:uncharacterized protein YdaU (DUF1376 family)